MGTMVPRFLGLLIVPAVLLAPGPPASAQTSNASTSSAVARTSDSTADPAQPVPGRKLTLSGCAATQALEPAPFRLYDPHHGMMYKLTAAPLGAYVGRTMQVIGGLLPTPNVAAQFGSIDPTAVAVATTTVNLSGSTPFNRPKPHVASVQAWPRCTP